MKSHYSSTVVHAVCPYENAALNKDLPHCYFVFSLLTRTVNRVSPGAEDSN